MNGNVVNCGLVVKQGDWIYYALADKVYRCKEDGSEKEKLCDVSAHINYVSVVDDYIYFDSDGFYVAKTDGSECTLLLEDKTDCKGIYIIDGFVYYGNEYRVKVGSSEVEQIYESNSVKGMTLNIDNEWLYFSELDSTKKYSSLSKMKLDGSDVQEIYSGLVSVLVVQGDWAFIANEEDKNLYKMKTDGTNLQLLVEGANIGFMNISGEWIYYYGYDGAIYKVKTDGSDHQMMFYAGMYCLHIIEDWIYYRVELGQGRPDLYRMKLDGSEQQIFATPNDI